MSYIFVSYSHEDQEFANELETQLQEHNFEVWIDGRIAPGDVWEKHITKAIKDCGAFIILMTGNSSQSKYVAKEINDAIALGKTLIPILLNGQSFRQLSHIQHETMAGEVRLTPRIVAKVRRALNTKQSTAIEVQSLKYYVEELESSLSALNKRPMAGDIIKYQNQRVLIEESIKENLTPPLAPLDFNNQGKVDEIFSQWDDLVKRLREYADEIDEAANELRLEIGDLRSQWKEELEENPDSIELSSRSQADIRSMYGGDLFDER